MKRFLTTLSLIMLLSTPTIAQETTEKAPQFGNVPAMLQCTTDYKAFEKIAREIDGQVAIMEGSNERSILRIFVNIETGTITVFNIAANGSACVIAQNENTEFLKPEFLEEKESDS